MVQIKLEASRDSILIEVPSPVDHAEKWVAALQTELGETILRQALVVGTNRIDLEGIQHSRVVIKIDSMFRTVVREINLLQTE